MTRQTIYRLEGSLPSEPARAASARPRRSAGVGREFDPKEEVNSWTYGTGRAPVEERPARPRVPFCMPPSTPHAF